MSKTVSFKNNDRFIQIGIAIVTLRKLRGMSQEKLAEKQGVEFSKHAMQRVEERSIDLSRDDTLDRLNRGVELAAGKGSSETLVLVGRNAFVVSVKNNKVITTLSDNELQGNVFTNIDSTVIV